ncbi:MAG TPA: class I SAM-dependent methyltransferase [Gammaproteobacteria bacterium]
MNESIYAKKPLRYIRVDQVEIPCFSASDDYVENYEKISADHVGHMELTGENPFIDEKFWIASEESTIDLINKYIKQGDKLLDVGVGLGRLLENYPQYDRYGIDISTSYLSISKRRGIDVCYSKIEDMPYKDCQFDIVVCTDVLEHVFNLYDACQKIISTVKKGGVLIVRVPYKEDLSNYLNPEYPYEYVHLRNFDEYSLQMLFEKIHKLEMLEIVKAPYLMPFLVPKLNIPVTGWRWLVRNMVIFTQIFGEKTYRRIIQKMFLPYEINIVLRKV